MSEILTLLFLSSDLRLVTRRNLPRSRTPAWIAQSRLSRASFCRTDACSQLKVSLHLAVAAKTGNFESEFNHQSQHLEGRNLCVWEGQMEQVFFRSEWPNPSVSLSRPSRRRRPARRRHWRGHEGWHHVSAHDGIPLL